ncbi:hypothetical protein HDV05_004125 [Chytridiales sp. JEL 0842]|nr:hypothetical protein HDV05_004125 [Chytridiales sp. JEL 0842]
MKLQSPSSSPQFSFKKLDACSMEACKEFAEQVATVEEIRRSGLHFLVLTAGHLNIGTRRDTSEGIESTFALNYLSKFVIINKLLPVLEKAQNARVVSVLSGGNGGKLDPDDFQLKKGRSFISSAITNAAQVDILTDHLAQKYRTTPNAPHFYHLFPGVVNTNNVYNSGLPTWLAIPAKLGMNFIAADPKNVAEEIVYVCTSDEFVGPEKNGAFLQPGLRRVARYPQLDNERIVGRLWEESAKLAKMD